MRRTGPRSRAVIVVERMHLIVNDRHGRPLSHCCHCPPSGPFAQGAGGADAPSREEKQPWQASESATSFRQAMPGSK